MNLVQFLSQKNHYFKQSNEPVLLFKGFEYPLLFFSYFFTFLKNNKFHVVSIHPSGETFSSLCAQFEMHFLGKQVIYWLGDITELDGRLQKKLITYLAQYKGPHQLLAYVPNTITISHPIPQVVLEKYTNFAVIEQLALLFNNEIDSDIRTCMTIISSKLSSLSLDKACLLLDFYKIGFNKDNCFNEWLDLMVTPEMSLFTLSQYFFAQNKKAFFKQWSLLAHHYSDSFWLTFWSEQLWRAVQLITLLKQKNMMQAKRIAFRLPFSFIKNDWQLYTSSELACAHHFVYMLDYHIKNGGNSDFLHLFFMKFLSRDFRS